MILIDSTIIQVFAAIEVVAVPLAIWFLQRSLGKKLNDFDSKRDRARIAQAEADKKAIEQREAERTIILAISRTMLLDNYEKCINKGCYTVEEREVYHKLYEAYKDDGGNSVIDEIAPRIRRLPIEPPKQETL